MTEDTALTVLARDLLAALLDDHGAGKWEDYPDLGEHDWDRVLGRAYTLAARPERQDFTTAYQLLAAHAEATP